VPLFQLKGALTVMRGWTILFGLISIPGVATVLSGGDVGMSMKSLTILSVLLLTVSAATGAVRDRV
jgi:hypothetical protein